MTSVKKIPLEGKLSLKNNGCLQLFFLGVGSAFALKHYQTNFILIKGDQHILVDFGSTGHIALSNVAGLTPLDIENVLITHSHADHAGGVEALALMNRYVGQRLMKKNKLKMVITEEYQRELWEHTLQGGLKYNEVDGQLKHLSFSDFFDVIRPVWKAHQPREIFEVQIGDIHLEIFRTMHMPEQSKNWEASFISYGLFIDGHVLITCDTKLDLDLLKLYGHRAGVIFHDVQFFPGAVHAPLLDLEWYLPLSIKRRMYLKHYADNYDQQDIKHFAGWAEQGLIYEFEKVGVKI